ncbi:MAG: hypothetical protein HYV63_25950 [Candidatus Schekmanbacteria bacterium]|nr:hypothetical protein [Candidatus Schekmanbacteria bacterium]
MKAPKRFLLASTCLAILVTSAVAAAPTEAAPQKLGGGSRLPISLAFRAGYQTTALTGGGQRSPGGFALGLDSEIRPTRYLGVGIWATFSSHNGTRAPQSTAATAGAADSAGTLTTFPVNASLLLHLQHRRLDAHVGAGPTLVSWKLAALERGTGARSGNDPGAHLRAGLAVRVAGDTSAYLEAVHTYTPGFPFGEHQDQIALGTRVAF